MSENTTIAMVSQMASGYGRAPAVGLPRDAIRLCPVMPEPHVETFRARTMIMNSFGQ